MEVCEDFLHVFLLLSKKLGGAQWERGQTGGGQGGLMDWLLWDKQDLQAKWTGLTGGELQRALAAETIRAIQAPASISNLSKIVLAFSFVSQRKKNKCRCL